jgi:hypothetical protein
MWANSRTDDSIVYKRNLQTGANNQSWAENSPAPVLSPSRTDLSVLYTRLDERDALLCRYLREGLLNGHRCIAYLDSSAWTTALNRLGADIEGNINADAVCLSGQLDVRDATEQPTSASELWAEVVEQDVCPAFPRTRVIVEAEHCNPGWREPRHLLQFESEIMSFARDDPIMFMFMYDLRDLDGALVVRLARARYMLWAGAPLANP